jgi:polar amino acid transport system ATP-binding protein
VEGADRVSAVLSLRGVTLTRAGRPVLAGVSFEVGRGDFVALMGLSGGGKTTVLRAVAALDAFDAGEIDVDGVSLRPGAAARRGDLRELRRRVGMVFQSPSLFEHLTALENVTLAPVRVLGMPREGAEARARGLLAALGVASRASALPRELSGGEAQRVAIARALAMDPPLLLMDEPTAALDPARRTELGESLEALRRDGRTLLVTTHDDDFAWRFATRVVVLGEGTVVEEGDPSRVLSAPQHPETRRLLASGERPPHGRC